MTNARTLSTRWRAVECGCALLQPWQWQTQPLQSPHWGGLSEIGGQEWPIMLPQSPTLSSQPHRSPRRVGQEHIVVLDFETPEIALVRAEVNLLDLHNRLPLMEGLSQPLNLILKLITRPRHRIEVVLSLDCYLTQFRDSRIQIIVLLLVLVLPALGKLVTKSDKKRQKVTKRRLFFVIHYRATVFLLTLTKIDKNLTLSRRFCRIRQKETKQSLWSNYSHWYYNFCCCWYYDNCFC